MVRFNMWIFFLYFIYFKEIKIKIFFYFIALVLGIIILLFFFFRFVMDGNSKYSREYFRILDLNVIRWIG